MTLDGATFSPAGPPSSPSTSVAVGMSLIFGALIVVGIGGNTMVCLAIYANKKLRKKENFYFVSLAAADLLLCLLVMPFAAYNDIVDQWPFGDYCKIWMSIDIMCCTASILHLCAVSFDRCYHIHYPMQYGQRMTGGKILSAISLVWILSATIAFAPLAFKNHFDQALSAVHLLEWTNSTVTSVSVVLTDKKAPASYSTYYSCSFNLNPSYAIISSMVSFYSPSCVMIVAYAKLYKYARRHAKTIRHQLETASMTRVQSTTAPTNLSVSKAEEKKKSPVADENPTITAAKRREIGASDSKARITLGIILGLFIFSWGPFFVCNIARSFCGACVPQTLFVALTWMGYANSAQNPIIYSIFNRDFRMAFGKILLCGKPKKRPSITAVHDRSLVTVSRNRLSYNKDAGRRTSHLSCSKGYS